MYLLCDSNTDSRGTAGSLDLFYSVRDIVLNDLISTVRAGTNRPSDGTPERAQSRAGRPQTSVS
jgi:hypothetical protein